jgi:hypothetical protein
MKNQFRELIVFLERLDEAKIHYTMQHSRDNAIQITAFAPGEYWEIEFIEDEGIEIERFRSNGEIYEAPVLEELFALCSDEEPSPQKVLQPNDAAARK